MVVRVATRRRSEDLEVAAAALFEQVTAGLRAVAFEVMSGPALRVVPPAG